MGERSLKRVRGEAPLSLGGRDVNYTECDFSGDRSMYRGRGNRHNSAVCCCPSDEQIRCDAGRGPDESPRSKHLRLMASAFTLRVRPGNGNTLPLQERGRR